MIDLAVVRAERDVARTPTLKEVDDSTLVARFLAGERRAFTELADRYHVRLMNFIQRTIGDRDRAEDLVQETFIRVYRHLHRFDQTKKFSTWVYTIAGNLAKNELRNRSRNPLVLFQTIKKNWDADHRAVRHSDEGPFVPSETLEDFVARWTALPGIGPWTAHYLALRALGHPDAFPAGDLVLQKTATGDGSRLAHPYTRALWRALPRNGFVPLPGAQPQPDDLPPGCLFADRCPLVVEECRSGRPARRPVGRSLVRCIRADGD